MSNKFTLFDALFSSLLAIAIFAMIYEWKSDMKDEMTQEQAIQAIADGSTERAWHEISAYDIDGNPIKVYLPKVGNMIVVDVPYQQVYMSKETARKAAAGFKVRAMRQVGMIGARDE